MDDGLLVFAFTCLCGGTFVLFERTTMIYLEFAVLRMDSMAYQIAKEQLDDLDDQSKWQFAYSVLLWTTIFAVKWCYFALFHSFLQVMSKGFNVFQSCPLPLLRCSLLVAFWTSSILDSLTDVISIPIAILRQSQMRPLTKVGLGCFLCLSAFMLSCSIIRAALTYYDGKLYPWQVFWLHSEGRMHRRYDGLYHCLSSSVNRLYQRGF